MMILSYQDFKLLEAAKVQTNVLTDNEKLAALLLQKLNVVSDSTVHGDFGKNIKDNKTDQIKQQLDNLTKKEPHIKDFVNLIEIKKQIQVIQDKIAIAKGKTEPDNTAISQLNAQLKAEQAKYQLTADDYYKTKK